MINSISQSGSASGIWQAYQAQQTAASETSDSSETTPIDGKMPPPKGPPPPPPPEGSESSADSTTLTTEQEDLISSLLEEYDADSLDEDDATAIISALRDAGIPAGSALADAVEENGFDLQEILDLVPASASMPNGGISQNYLEIRESLGSLSILDENALSQSTQTNQSLLSLFQQYQNYQDSGTTNRLSMDVLA